MDNLKIIGLKIDGYQKLSAVEMKFPTDGGCIYVRGGNEQGKTSVIECLWWLFSGKTIINPEKIQHGKDKINGMVDLGDFAIERIQTDKSDRLEIKKKGGFSVTEKKQAFLNRLTNQLTFNPFPFLNLPEEKKLKFMMDFLKIDFSEIDEKIKSLEQERLFVGREINGIGKIEEIPKVEPVDVQMLLEEKNKLQNEIDMELKEIRKYNQEQISRKNNRLFALRESVTIGFNIQELEEKLKIEKEKLSQINTKIEALPEPEPFLTEMSTKNTIELDKQIIKANEKNLAYENWKRNEDRIKRVIVKKEKYENLTDEIKSLKESKTHRLSQTDTGVNGLQIKETGLYYKGIFLENCSDSEKLRISMQLCQAMNPPLKAVFLDRGESFDASRIEEIEKFARENDIQVFITQVVDEIPEEIPSNVFYIVEGEVKK